MTESNRNLALPVGVLRIAQIVRYDVSSGLAKIKLVHKNETLTDTSNNNDEIFIPNAIYSDNGIYVGALVKENTPILVGRGEGGKWYFISFIMNNPLKAPKLVPNQLLIQSSNDSKITLDTSNNISIGSDTDKVHYYINKNDINDTLESSTFNNSFKFTEAARTIDGIVKREVRQLANFPSALKLESDDFSSRIYSIALDPTVTKSPSFIDQVKNPPFTENRKIVYEFGYSFGIQDDLTESQLYDKHGVATPTTNISSTRTNRRQSRADTLSLSLVAPNYLMETVKGTVIDIFGNILDINRSPIPIGTKDLTLSPDSGGNIQSDAFNNIKAAERKSIAYHFELNARKDLKFSNNNTLLNLIDINSSEDYARMRSRFFFDVDKEGQFKLNIPASSETGNVSLLARYENYSTFGPEEDGNPNKLIFRDDNLDIFLDSFSTQDITIMDNTAVATPIDRLLNTHIKKGMPFHSITNSLQVFQDGFAQDFLDFQYNKSVDLLSLPTLTNVVSPIITVGGPKANAGGRSGSAHLDGSFELSLGANTVDRQSLWLDTAGSMIGNFGRDLNNVSAGLSFDGDLLIQVGGIGVSTDSRFAGINNAYRGGAFDIRVLNDGFTVSVIRIDKNGITIATPNTITLKGRDISIVAEGNLILEGDNVQINDRFVAKFPASSI